MNGFAPNLTQTPRIRSLDNFYPQKTNPTKSICGGRHIENHIFCHNLAIIANICIEFDTDAENSVPQPDLPSKFT